MIKSAVITGFFLAFFGCSQQNKETNSASLKRNEALFQQYAYLLQRSLVYVEQNKDFIGSIQQFVDTCSEYDFTNNARVEPIILEPVLFSKNTDSALILVLSRKLDLKKERVEYVHFIYGKSTNGHWRFKLKPNYSRSFSYIGNYPTMSEAVIFLQVLRNLIDAGYMGRLNLEINDSFFLDHW